jgi:hypothetical protein
MYKPRNLEHMWDSNKLTYTTRSFQGDHKRQFGAKSDVSENLSSRDGEAQTPAARQNVTPTPVVQLVANRYADWCVLVPYLLMQVTSSNFRHTYWVEVINGVKNSRYLLKENIQVTE